MAQQLLAGSADVLIFQFESMIKRIFVAVLLTVVSLNPSLGQRSLDSQQPERKFEEAMSHFRRGYYGVARQLFEEVKHTVSDEQRTLRSDAAFYEALSSSRLDNDDASFLLERFIDDHPGSPHLSHARFRIGELAHESNRYRVAIRWYDRVDPNDLDRDVRLRYYFKAGYANFMEEEYDKAARLLNQVKDVPSDWWGPANYYYAHIQYDRGNHQSALRTFTRLKNEPGFQNVVPYYIAQIYYMQGDYDQAIEYGTPLMADARGVMRTDLARVLGDAWYAKENYSRAIPYLSIVVKETKTPRREDYYHLGLSYYFVNDFEQAAVFLAQVTSSEDDMTQNAYYHLADCYLRLGDKQNARIAFEAAQRLHFDKAIREDAMFNYIKLSYELSFSPFNEIINSFLQFIEEFPESQHIDEAYRYLGQALLTTRNYRQALEAMERIQHKNADVYRAMQRVSYYRGLELFTNLQFTDAIAMFDYSLNYGRYDNTIKMGALYWRGESHYRLGNYQKALADYTQFIETPGSRNLPEFVTAHYNIGYCHFNLGNFSAAGQWFRRFLVQNDGRQPAKQGDALNRLGDTYFMVRDFRNAMTYYERAAALPEGSPDYAMFQRAISLGISRDHDGKIRQLNELITRFPRSPYLDDAWYEMGRSFVAKNDLNEAIRCFKTVRDRFPRSRFAKKSMLQLGLVYYNTGDLNQSMVFYKRVVNEFPGTPEAEDALLGIRNIYMDQNNPDGYIRYTNQIGGFARVDDRQRDSLSYVSAERLYMSGNCAQALVQLQNYLTSFPQGRFVLNAHYYKADCQFRDGKYEEALVSYEFVTGRGRSLFSEDALRRAGQIHFRKENYGRALDYFKRLEEEADLEENRQEALIGQMRALRHLGTPTSIIEASERVLDNPRMAPEIVREARFLKAKAHIDLNQKQRALEDFEILAENTSSREGSEARFRVIEILYEEGKRTEAEQKVFDFVNRGTPHQYWLARSFIVLSDIFADRGEFFQATQYLESLLENYTSEEDDVRELAQERLDLYRRQVE